MKRTAIFLALALGATALFGQGPAPDTKKDAVTTINDKGAVAQPVIQSTPADSTRIKAPAPQPSGLGSGMENVNLLQLLKSAGWPVWVLAGMSVLTCMLVLYNLFTLRRSSILTAHYMNTADVLLKKRDYLGLLAISSRHSEAVARVVQRTLDFATKNPSASFEVVREIAESEGAGQAAVLQHRPTYLADIGMLSPMVGLLGTVIGIIASFGELAHGENKARDVLLAGGVAQALVATAGGLIIGIVAFMFYAYFRNKVQGLISDMEGASAHLLGLIALNYNKKREASRVALEDDF